MEGRRIAVGGLIPFAAVDALTQSERDSGSRPLDLLGEGPIVPTNDRNERLEGTDQLQRHVVDLKAHDIKYPPPARCSCSDFRELLFSGFVARRCVGMAPLSFVSPLGRR